MRVLVTGAAGFIGQHLTRELTDAGHDVTGVDMRDGDLREPPVAERLMTEHAPEVVVHLAAQVGREFGEDDLHITVTSNALATARVAQASQAHGARLMYVSTSEVYGDQGEAWCYETTPPVIPHNAYGLTKRHGEELAALYNPVGLQIVRLSMPYGPGLPAGRGRAAIVNMLHQAHWRKPITVHRGAARCWCWVGDTVYGIRLVLERGEAAAGPHDILRGHGVYNVGRSDTEVTMLKVAELACRIAGADTDLIQEVDAPRNQTVVKRLGMTKMHSLGWRPETELLMGMQILYEHVKRYDEDGSIPDGPAPVVLGAPAASSGVQA